MEVQFFCPRWGSESLPWEDFIVKVREAGYDGIEYAIPSVTNERTIEQVCALADRYGLRLIAQHYDTYTADFSKHYDQYASWLERMRRYPWVKINSQTGRDLFSFEENSALIGLAGPDVVHEIHRGKFSFAAHVTSEYLRRMPELRLTFDVSHWVVVAESYLEDQAEAVEMAIRRSAHIHARVGYPEGPQIPDPRLPEWQEAVAKHVGWWKRIAERYVEGPALTVTTEFGPFPYLVHPFSQWEMNLHMMGLLKRELTMPLSQGRLTTYDDHG